MNTEEKISFQDFLLYSLISYFLYMIYLSICKYNYKFKNKTKINKDE